MNESNGVTTAPAINEIAAALAKAQLEMQNPAFDSSNPHFKSKFASLAAVRNAIVPVLAKHGISLAQDIRNTERGIACLTILTHSSGQQMVFGPLEMPATKADAQGLGSAATYARRYAMMAVCGVVGDEDDDGNGATAKPQQTDQQALQKAIDAIKGAQNVGELKRHWQAAFEMFGHDKAAITKLEAAKAEKMQAAKKPETVE